MARLKYILSPISISTNKKARGLRLGLFCEMRYYSEWPSVDRLQDVFVPTSFKV
jgi:hypothetical protein